MLKESICLDLFKDLRCINGCSYRNGKPQRHEDTKGHILGFFLSQMRLIEMGLGILSRCLSDHNLVLFHGL